MNKLSKIVACPLGDTAGASPSPITGAPATYPCPECEGVGIFSSGAYHPDDPRISAEWDCENCGGTGEVEPTCQCGDPLDEHNYCKSCEDYWPSGWELAERSAIYMGGKL